MKKSRVDLDVSRNREIEKIARRCSSAKKPQKKTLSFDDVLALLYKKSGWSRKLTAARGRDGKYAYIYR